MLHLSPKPLQSLNEFTFFTSPKPLLWFQIGSAVVSDRLYKESLRRATHSEQETLKAQPVTSCHLVPAQRRPCWYGDDRKWAWATWIFLTALATAELVFQEGSASPPSFPPSRTQTCERRTPECWTYLSLSVRPTIARVHETCKTSSLPHIQILGNSSSRLWPCVGLSYPWFSSLEKAAGQGHFWTCRCSPQWDRIPACRTLKTAKSNRLAPACTLPYLLTVLVSIDSKNRNRMPQLPYQFQVLQVDLQHCWNRHCPPPK